MRMPLLTMAVLVTATWAATPAGAQQSPTNPGGQGAAGAGAAIQGGVQGDCPAGQVRGAGGGCAPGQPNPTGTITGPAGAAQMPASPHQQQVLKPMQDMTGSKPQ